MITKFKIYESINDGEPEIGDYVICDPDFRNLFNFINNNIGQIINYPSTTDKYVIKYENVPESIYSFFDVNISLSGHTYKRYFQRDEIIYWSKNKEDLEHLIQSKKYNL